jgi:hypothetical protein
MTTKQVTAAIISSIQKVANGEDKDKDDSTPKKSNAADAFGGREGAKRSKTSE